MRKLDPANLKLIGSLFVLVFLFASVAIIVRLTSQQRSSQPKAAESQTFTARTSDSFLIWRRNQQTPADPTGDCHAAMTTDYAHEVGTAYNGDPFFNYFTFRSYLSFDTSSIPTYANITEAYLRLTLDFKDTNSGFTLYVRDFSWEPTLSCSEDYGGNPPTASLASSSLHTSSLPGHNQSFNVSITNLSTIKKGAGALTSFMLTSNREENNNVPNPQVGEYFQYYSADYSTASYRPQLIISYTAPPPTADIKANGSNVPITIGYNSSATISWSSSNADSCSVTPGGWAGLSNSGVSTGNLTSSTTYTLTCTGAGGTKSDSVAVNVSSKTQPPKPPGPKPPGPSAGGTLTSLQLSVSVPYLVGKMKVPVLIGSLRKEVEVSSDKKDYSLDVKEANLSLGNSLTIVVGGNKNKTLIKKINLKADSGSMTVAVGDLILGDITGDNKIDDKDSLALLTSITSQTTKGDLNADKVANSLDWAILLTNFGKSGDF